jgi:hypothetical protein
MKEHTRVLRNYFLVFILMMGNYFPMQVQADEKPTGKL